MGGDMNTRTMIGFVGVVTTGTLVLAIHHIRRLEIHLHRVWMLRTWGAGGYMAFVVSLGIIQSIMASIITRWPAATVEVASACRQLRYTYLADEGAGSWDVFSQADLDPSLRGGTLVAHHPPMTGSRILWPRR